jgi:hypothetical protein
MEVLCPACGVALEADSTWAGQPIRCGVCRNAFQFALDEPRRLTGPLWPRVRTGLSLTLTGGLALLIAFLFLIAMLLVFALAAGPEQLQQLANPGDPSVEAILLSLGSCGVSLVGLLAVLLIVVGSFYSLAVPPETGARNWLAASLSCLLVCLVLGLGAGVTALPLLMAQVQQGAVPQGGLAAVLSALLLVAAGLALISVVAYGQFLSRLAVYLDDFATARSAAGYLFFVVAGSSLGLCGLCLLGLFQGGDFRAAFVAQLALVLLLSLQLGWWLTLVARLRSLVAHGL